MRAPPQRGTLGIRTMPKAPSYRRDGSLRVRRNDYNGVVYAALIPPSTRNSVALT
jgi:hypothetical protein